MQDDMTAHLRRAVMKSPVGETLKRLFSALLFVSLVVGPGVTGAVTFLVASVSTDAANAATAGTDASADKPEGDNAEDDDDDAKIRQAVRVADLIGADVIAPVESQDLLGHVKKIVRSGDGETFVVTYGGHFGFGTRPVCVPADALYLTGRSIQVKGIKLDELDRLPECDGAAGTVLEASATIRMKLAKPAH
jgi:hypothetical protein